MAWKRPRLRRRSLVERHRVDRSAGSIAATPPASLVQRGRAPRAFTATIVSGYANCRYDV
jgi:hypothetical protein